MTIACAMTKFRLLKLFGVVKPFSISAN